MDDNNTAYLKCKLCLPRFFRLSYCGKSTSTMIYHIQGTHPSEHDKLENTAWQKNNKKISSYMKTPPEWRLDGKKSIEMQRKAVRFVTGTNQSLSIVDNPLFRDLLPAEFVTPSRKYFTNVCLPTAYEKQKKNYYMTYHIALLNMLVYTYIIQHLRTLTFMPLCVSNL